MGNVDDREARVERAVAALLPFADRWGFQVNPEDLHEIAYAVLTHADGGEATEAEFLKIDAAVRGQIAEYEKKRKAFDRDAYGRSG